MLSSMKIIKSLVSLSLLMSSCAARYVVYYDQYKHTHSQPASNRVLTLSRYHPNLTGFTPEVAAGIDHVIPVFVPSKSFNTDPPGNFTIFEDVAATRKRFDDGMKVLIAVGGWGDTDGFGIAAATEQSRTLFARNIATMLNVTGADGVGLC